MQHRQYQYDLVFVSLGVQSLEFFILYWSTEVFYVLCGLRRAASWRASQDRAPLDNLPLGLQKHRPPALPTSHTKGVGP